MNERETLARRPRRCLRMTAYSRRQLVEMLKRRALNLTASSRLTATNAYRVDGRVMGQINLDARGAGTPILVIPIALLAFDRPHSILREGAEFGRRPRAGL